MPRPAKSARLYLKPEERAADGSVRKRATWVIKDGSCRVSTGCSAKDRVGAERALQAYLAEKHTPQRDRGRDPAQILIADVLAIYLTDVAPKHSRGDETKQRALKLSEFWGTRTLGEVNGRSCRDYATWRTRQTLKSAKAGKNARKVTSAAARRELEDFRAAIRHHHREGLCSEAVQVVLPAKPMARDRWLTRSEAARLLWAAWRYREVQKGVETDRRSRRHVARFLLVGLYTGTRSSAICEAALEPTAGRGWVDLDRGVFYRRAAGKRETKKRQPPVRIPSRLLAHLRRWKASGASRSVIVEWNGEPVSSIRRAFAATVLDAGLGPEVTPHVLRHTCATWLMQRGVDLWEVAGFLGMTVQQLEATYGHHHPDFQSDAAEALGGPFGDRNPRNKRGQTASNVVEMSRKTAAA